MPVAQFTRFISLVDKSCREQYIDDMEEANENVNKTNTRVIISQVGDGLRGRVGIELFPLNRGHKKVLSDALFVGFTAPLSSIL